MPGDRAVRIHIGSGTVYLRGWINLDLAGPRTFLARDRPDLVDRYITTDDHYFARHTDKTLEALRTGPLNQDYVCDAYGSFFDLPPGPIDELLARHSFEHLSMREAHQALARLMRRMKPRGIVRLDVPDHEGTLWLFKQTGDDFYVRHLLGPRRDETGYHMMSYTRPRLQALMEHHGFRYQAEEPNIHFYPAFCLRFVRP